MEPSARGAARASFTRRCWSMSESPSKAVLTTVTWKWSPPPVLSWTSTDDAPGKAASSSSRMVAASTRPW